MSYFTRICAPWPFSKRTSSIFPQKIITKLIYKLWMMEFFKCSYDCTFGIDLWVVNYKISYCSYCQKRSTPLYVMQTLLVCFKINFSNRHYTWGQNAKTYRNLSGTVNKCIRFKTLPESLGTVGNCHLQGVVAGQLLSMSPFVAMGH